MSVTIGITAYNEEKNIGKLLDVLLTEKFLFNNKEIIVVSSGCTDRTPEIVKKIASKNKKIKLVSERKRNGKASAINLILKKAKGDIIVFICADNLPRIKSINRIVEGFNNESIGAVSGRPIPIESRNAIYGFVNNLIWDMHHEICMKKPKISGEIFGLRKGIVKKIPYNIINDDGYITGIVRKNYEIEYAKDAITYMTGINDFFSHIRRRRRIARGYIQLRKVGLNVDIPFDIKIKSFIRCIKKEPKKFHKIFFALTLEIIVNILAYYDTIRGTTPYCWEK